MSDPLGVTLLLGVGLFAVGVGAAGLWRGKTVDVFQSKRGERPFLFWFGIVFQMGLGIVCLVLAAVKAFQ
jgi:hypothetical protein